MEFKLETDAGTIILNNSESTDDKTKAEDYYN